MYIALWAGLNKLGYTAYHGLECSLDSANGSFDFWGEALKAKIDETSSVPKTSEDFDQALWRYDAVTDMPAVLFAEELLAAYPEAKVILTERDVDSWVVSMQRSLYRILAHRGLRVLSVIDVDFTKKYHPVLMRSLHIWTGGEVWNMEKLREGYMKHYERMRAIVPKERLLEWHARDGWEPLCSFLGKPVPVGEFPRVNQDTWAAEMHDWMVVYRFLVVGVKLLKFLSPLAVVGAAWWSLG